MCVCRPNSTMYKKKTTFMSCLLLSTPRVPVDELRLSGLRVSTFTHWATHWPHTILLTYMAIMKSALVGTRSSAHILWLFSLGFCRTSNNEKVSQSFTWDSFPPTGLLHSDLTREFMPSLIAMFGLYPWETCSFLKKNGGVVDLGEWGGRLRLGCIV